MHSNNNSIDEDRESWMQNPPDANELPYINDEEDPNANFGLGVIVTCSICGNTFRYTYAHTCTCIREMRRISDLTRNCFEETKAQLDIMVADLESEEEDGTKSKKTEDFGQEFEMDEDERNTFEDNCFLIYEDSEIFMQKCDIATLEHFQFYHGLVQEILTCLIFYIKRVKTATTSDVDTVDNLTDMMYEAALRHPELYTNSPTNCHNLFWNGIKAGSRQERDASSNQSNDLEENGQV